MEKHAGRTAALVTGIAVLVLLAFSLTYWRDMVIQYHLRRLARDPEYLIGSLGEREGSTANIAVRRFIAIADDQDLWRPRQALEYSKISPAVELKGQQATCAGEVEMRELFRFLSNYRGQSLVFPTASVALLGKKVTIPLKIARLDFDLAKALLRSQGFLVLEDPSIEGERELRIELVQNEK